MICMIRYDQAFSLSSGLRKLPRRAPGGPLELQDGPKMALGQPKTASRRFKKAPRRPHGAFKTAQEAPNRPPIPPGKPPGTILAPRFLSEASRESPGLLPGASRTPPGTPPGNSLDPSGELPGRSRTPPGSDSGTNSDLQNGPPEGQIVWRISNSTLFLLPAVLLRWHDGGGFAEGSWINRIPFRANPTGPATVSTFLRGRRMWRKP